MRELFKPGLFNFTLIFFLITNTLAQDFDTPTYSVTVQLDSIIVQPDTVFFLTPSDFDERTKFKINNTGSNTISVDTLLVTQNWFYEFFDVSGNYFSYPQPLSPGDSMTVAIYVAMLTGAGSTNQFIIDTLTVVMDIGQYDVIIVVDEGLVSEVSEPVAEVMVPSFVLKQNYPNPFNPETTIIYEVSNQTGVMLKILNLLGQEIRTLVNEEKPAGFYNVVWDARDNTGQQVASGIYVYRLETQDFVQTRKMVLLQ